MQLYPYAIHLLFTHVAQIKKSRSKKCMHLDYTWYMLKSKHSESSWSSKRFLIVGLEWSWIQIHLFNPELIHKRLTPGRSLKLHEIKKFCWNKLSTTLLATLTFLLKPLLLFSHPREKFIVDFSDKTLSVFISWGSLNLLIRIKLRSQRTYTPTLKQIHEKVFFLASTIIKICAENVFWGNERTNDRKHERQRAD